jgi:hypothetical protein
VQSDKETLTLTLTLTLTWQGGGWGGGFWDFVKSLNRGTVKSIISVE